MVTLTEEVFHSFLLLLGLNNRKIFGIDEWKSWPEKEVKDTL